MPILPLGTAEHCQQHSQGWTYQEELLVLPSWLEQCHLVWTQRRRQFCSGLESERVRSQVSEGQCSRYGLEHRGGGDLALATLVYYK